MTLLVASASAWACATCSDPRDGAAFLGPTIMMSLLPLAMMGSIFFWLGWSVKKARARQAEEKGGASVTVRDIRARASLSPDAR